MLDDIFHFAVKDKAQCVKSFSSDIHTLLHPVQGIGRNAMMKYQMILSNPFFQQSIICILRQKWLALFSRQAIYFISPYLLNLFCSDIRGIPML